MEHIPRNEVANFLATNGLKLAEVLSVKSTGKVEPVYDIGLKATGKLKHTFMANGIVVHNSVSHSYLTSIIETQGFQMDLKHVFGLKDSAGNWSVKPRVRYYSEGVAEKFFDYLASLERKLPDKVKINDQWYLIYENTKINQKALAGHYDTKYLTKTGKLRIPAQDGTLQALVILDSYPAMLPERLDVDDPGAGMAAQARMFSEQLRRVKGKMKAKRIAVIGVNQLRKAPMVMFGSPEYEPGGEAIRFFSDCRLRVYPRALSGVPGAKGKGMIEEEPSILESGGKDSYRYIHIRAHKNKLSVPNLEGWLRLWITDGEGVARGFDPVWDVYYYLRETGQISGQRSKLKLALDGRENPKKAIPWMDFKALVIGTKAQKIEVWKSLMPEARPFDLKGFCKKQLQERNGLDLYFSHMKSDASVEEGEE